MGDPIEGGPAYEPLDERTASQWRELSVRVAVANAAGTPLDTNDDLTAAARAEPQAPVAPAYLLWAADNLTRATRYPEAVRAFDAVVETAGSALTFVAGVDAAECAVRHKAQAATLAGDPTVAVATYLDLASFALAASEALLQAGLVAERAGNDDRAADLYALAADGRERTRADDPAQLARRSAQRLAAIDTVYTPDVRVLADTLADALESRDTALLSRLVGASHFAVGPVGGHVAFAGAEALDELLRDLLDGSVTARRTLRGSGGKRYLATTGWRGEWYRDNVVFILTRAPKGWQWTGVAVTQAHDGWVERWRPAVRQTNQPLPFTIRAPWPAGQSFTAGGLTGFVVQQAAIVAAGPLVGGLIAAGLARNACGFGPRGFYYNQGSTHDEEDAFAIDFTRYERNEPYNPESGGTPVLAVRDGVVARVSAGTSSGDSSASNTVEINHEDPANPSATDRFRSRYLHLSGPFQIRVSPMMFVIAGQRLGTMDDTGNSTLDHLHFSFHDRDLTHPGASFGRSVRPSLMDGVTLGDGDSGKCVRSQNVERVPGLNFRPTAVSFGGVPVGSVETRSVTMQNSAGRPVVVSIAASPPGPFEWAALQVTLPHRAEQTFTVRFRPVSAAIETTRMGITSDLPASPHRVTLVGKGPGGIPQPPPDPGPAQELDIRPDTITFGSVPIGSVETRQLTIENQTGRTVSLSFPAAPFGPFEWSAFSGSIAHGATRAFTLRFRAASSAIVRATLLITSNSPGSPHEVGMIGKGPGGFPTPV